MHATQERSHAANVANFEALITWIATLETRYSPGPDRLKLSYLQSRLTSTKGIMSTLNNALRLDSEARDRRSDLFATLAPIAVRVVRNFSLCTVSEQTKDSAGSILKKIQGRRIKPIK